MTSWLKGQRQPLAATGNMVFGRLGKQEHSHMRHSSGNHMFASQRTSYDKDALQGLLEGVRTSTYGQRMRALEQSGRLSVRRNQRGRSVDDPGLVDPRRGRTSTPIATRYNNHNHNHNRSKQDRVVSAPHGTTSSSLDVPWGHSGSGGGGGHHHGGGGPGAQSGNDIARGHQHQHQHHPGSGSSQQAQRLQNLTLANGFGFRSVRDPRRNRSQQSLSHSQLSGDSQSDVEPMGDMFSHGGNGRGGRFHQSSSLPGLASGGHHAHHAGRNPPRGGNAHHQHHHAHSASAHHQQHSGLVGSSADRTHGHLERGSGSAQGHQGAHHPGVDQLTNTSASQAGNAGSSGQAGHAGSAHVIKPRAFGAEDANPGYRPAMEDAYIVRDNFGGDPSWSYYGCYDGHGGKAVVDFTLAHLHEIFLQELQAVNWNFAQIRGVFDRSFQTIDNQLRHLGTAWHCGTTCTVALVYTPPTAPMQAGRNTGENQQQQPIRTLFIGNVGDSRASLVNSTSGGERLTVDHKASDPSEHARVTSEGGVISRGRVGGQLMLTRALGDFAFKTSGVTCKPYYAQRELKPDDVCICLATDGLWDVLDEDDVARIVLATSRKGDKLRRVAQNLVDVSKNRGSADNITTCVVFL